MFSITYFTNPYEDHIKGLQYLVKDALNPKCKVVTSLEAKWEETSSKLKKVDSLDYTVYTGTSGIALLKLLKDPNNKTNLEEIRQLLGLHKLRNRRITFLCGDAGPLTIGAIVNHRLGNEQEKTQLIGKLLSMSDDAVNSRSDLANEYLYGRAGYLFALLYVNKHIDPPPISKDLIREIIEAIITCGKNQRRLDKFKCPLIYQWHDSYYLGAAHGISGIVYLLLQAKEHLTDAELETLIRPTIDYLATLKFESGNYPSTFGSKSDKKIQWCHGAPGFVFLFSMAYKVFKDQKYLDLALEAGEVVWQRGLTKKGYSICHGVSGNAYSFLELFQTTEDEKHLHRAIKFAHWCLEYTSEHEEYSPDRPLSLFEGIAGPMYFLLDIQKPMEAKFPGFTL